MPVVRSHIGEKIEADGVFQISGVEISEVIRPPRWDVVQQLFRQITMWID